MQKLFNVQQFLKLLYRHLYFQRLIAFSLLAFSIQCRSPVVQSTNESFSAGTLAFILPAFFTDELILPESPEVSTREKLEKEKERRIARIQTRIQDLMAAGELATKYGFNDDEYYSTYVFLQTRGRHSRAAGLYFTRHLGENYKIPDILKLLKINISPKNVNDTIEKSVVRDGANIKTREPLEDIQIGTDEKGKIYLSDIAASVSGEDFSRLLSFSYNARLGAITEVVRGYTDRIAHDLLRSEMQAQESQLFKFDHHRASELFLSAKFGKAGKGVYPTGTLELKFSPTELYDHYFQILPALTPMRYVIATGAIFKNQESAERFASQWKDKITLRTLCNRAEHIQCGLKWHIRGYKNAKDLAEREERSLLDNWILKNALESKMYPDVQEINGLWYTLKIDSIQFEDDNPTFEKYSWAVRRDLTMQSLNLLLESEMKTIKQRLNVQFEQEAFIRIFNKSIIQKTD